MIRKTSYAVHHESCPTLNGINIVAGERLTLVSTDGRRLALVGEIEAKAQFALPTKAVAELQRLLTAEGKWR